MTKTLRELADVEYGASPKEVRVDYSTPHKIYGTGGLVGYSHKPLFDGPLIVVARKGTLDNPVFSEAPCWVIDTAYAVIPKKDNDAKWLYYQLLNYDLKRLNEATGVPSINRDFLYRVEFTETKPSAQRKIARILSTVDAVIEQTEQTVVKFKAIKAGMLQDLFTRGLDANGVLRPHQAVAPHLYKQSELGWIPVDWNVDTLESICEINPSTSPPSGLHTNDEVSFIKMEDVSNEAEIANTNTRKLQTLYKKGFTPFVENDILFAKITPCMENGKGALVTNLKNGFGFGSTEFHVLRARDDKSTRFLFYLTTSKEFRLKAEGNMSGSAGQQRVPTSSLQSYQFGVPSPDERFDIGLRADTINKKIQTEQTYLYKLQKLKAGLMNDLLSGVKPVVVKEEPTPPSLRSAQAW